MGPRLAALLIALLLPAVALADAARTAVEAFVSRLSGAAITDLTIEQTFTVYHPDGLHPQSTGEQRVWTRLPRRQRIEQVMDGKREVRLVVGEQIWIRNADGRVSEAAATERDRTQHLVMPFRRTADDILAEWRGLGVRDDVSHVTRIGTRTVTVIGAKLGEREAPSVWLDPELGVVRVVRREKLPRGEGIVDLTFSEHRPLTGTIAFPHRQEAFVNGKLLLLVVVRSVAVNTNLADALFDPESLRRAR